MVVISVYLKANSNDTQAYDVKSITSAASYPGFHSPK